MELRFEGHSDDTFGEYGHFRDDYDCCASGNPIAYMVIDGDGNGLHVVGQYSGRDWLGGMHGCWMIGVQQLDEDKRLPRWPMRWETAANGYSPTLVIDAPQNANLVCLNREDDQ